MNVQLKEWMFAHNHISLGTLVINRLSTCEPKRGGGLFQLDNFVENEANTVVNILLRVGLVTNIISLHRENKHVFVHVVLLIVHNLHDLLNRVHLAHFYLLTGGRGKTEIFDNFAPLTVQVIAITIQHGSREVHLLRLIRFILS